MSGFFVGFIFCGLRGSWVVRFCCNVESFCMNLVSSESEASG